MSAFVNQDTFHNFDESCEYVLSISLFFGVGFYEFYLSFQATNRDFSFKKELFLFFSQGSCIQID